jgi:signal transduction histidine kinase
MTAFRSHLNSSKKFDNQIILAQLDKKDIKRKLTFSSITVTEARSPSKSYRLSDLLLSAMRSVNFWQILWFVYFILLILYVVLFLHNRQKEKKIEQQRIQQQLIANEQLKIYENLSVKMAHEIRNYLNKINMNNDNCLDKLKNLEQFLEDNSFLFEELYESETESPKNITRYFERKFIQTENNIHKISLIIENVLAETTDYSQQSELLTNVNSLIDKIVKESNWQKNQVFEAEDFKFEFNYDSDLPQVLINPIDFEGVLVNLLTNACDSLYEKKTKNLNYCPKIIITTLKSTSNIEIKVKDNGIGISTNNLEKIFNPFWTTKSSVDGIGVGLFFSLQRVKKYGGTISINSVEGEWAEFTISLPFTQQ